MRDSQYYDWSVDPRTQCLREEIARLQGEIKTLKFERSDLMAVIDTYNGKDKFVEHLRRKDANQKCGGGSY